MLNISVDATQLEKFAEAMELFPERVDQTVAEAMPEAENVLHQEMVVHPVPIPYLNGANDEQDPRWKNTNVRWASLRQRAWYNNNRPMPYERQGALDSALKNQPVEISGGVISGGVISMEEWVKYVIGDKKDQTELHKNRVTGDPWRETSQIRDDAFQKVSDVFRKSINRLVESFKI